MSQHNPTPQPSSIASHRTSFLEDGSTSIELCRIKESLKENTESAKPRNLGRWRVYGRRNEGMRNDITCRVDLCRAHLEVVSVSISNI